MAVENLKDDQLMALEKAEGYAEACHLIEDLEREGFEAYLVGGCVRDVLLGRELKDFDMCTSATPEQMKSIFKDYKLLLHGENFGTVSVLVDSKPYEITTYRGDGVYSDSRHPDSVDFRSSLEEDLKRRDFTVNALAFHPKQGLVDFVGGLDDIRNKVLRTVGDPRVRFKEDALRIARLVRFSVQLDFDIEEGSLKAALACAQSLKKISKERVYAEFCKMVEGRPQLPQMDLIIGTSFEETAVSGPPQFFGPLAGFWKAWVAICVCRALKVNFEDYVLEKTAKEKARALDAFTESKKPERSFIRLCDRHKLYGSDQKKLWTLVCMIRPDLGGVRVEPYSSKLVSEAVQSLRLLYKGKDLGEAVFRIKREHFFPEL